MVKKNEAEVYVLNSKWGEKLQNSIEDIWVSLVGSASLDPSFVNSLPFSQETTPPFLESGIKGVSTLPH